MTRDEFSSLESVLCNYMKIFEEIDKKLSKGEIGSGKYIVLRI